MPDASSPPSVTILNGDCRALLPTLEPVDAVVTDPPYGLDILEQGWDHGVPGAEFWKLIRDAMKPGAHLLAFGGTRTYHRLACAIEDAGLEIRDQLMWLYGSGTPKSRDVSKVIDSRRDWQALRALQGKVRTARLALGISQSEAARRMGLIAPDASLGGGGFMWFETGLRVPTREQYPALKKALELDGECDLAFEAAEREVLETRADTGGTPFIRPGKGPGHEYDVTAPATEAAKTWAGWGTGLKPAWEPIILARRPPEGTVAQNVLTYGTGALNIEGSRVPWGGDQPTQSEWNRMGASGPAGGNGYLGQMGAGQKTAYAAGKIPVPTGRWPANLLHDGSEEVVGCFPEASQARFFYSGKASGADRGTYTKGALPLFDIPAEEVRNEHPTVKPVELMAYLCRLITPPGGTVLDPFMGSGSTLLAARREGFHGIGIELQRNYCVTAERRLREDGADLPTYPFRVVP